MTYIYFINVLGTDLYKVGYTNNLNRRLREIQTGNEQTLVLNLFIEFPTRFDARKNERAIHDSLKELNMNGEWFEIDPDYFYELERVYDVRSSHEQLIAQ